jgi:hypothetical protein
LLQAERIKLMATQPDGTEGKTPPVVQPPKIDLLRRVWIPIERRTVEGTLVFRTTDKELYCRLKDGSIRAVTRKTNGKIARRLRAALRKAKGDVHGQG